MNKFIFDENNDKGHSDSNLNESKIILVRTSTKTNFLMYSIAYSVKN